MTLTFRNALPMVAETAHGTVLFADLRGYMGLAEQLAPARIVPLLQEFFAILSSTTELHGGQIFHMAGDGMMAGFGFRDPSQDGAHEALAASRMMLQRFTPVATRWWSALSIETGLGVGLHFGEVALGFFGPPGRQAMTLVGDTVNVAARLCGRARIGEVLFSASVAAMLGEVLGRVSVADPDAGTTLFLQLPQFELRGRSERLDIWCAPATERIELRDSSPRQAVDACTDSPPTSLSGAFSNE